MCMQDLVILNVFLKVHNAKRYSILRVNMRFLGTKIELKNSCFETIINKLITHEYEEEKLVFLLVTGCTKINM